MSECGDGEYASVTREDDRVARKEHRCCACGETIAPGQTYHYVFFVFDGSPYTCKRCARCEAIYAHLSARLREEGDPEEYCNDRLDCGHEYAERWNEPPPEHIAALAFWLPGEPLPTDPRPADTKGSRQ